MHCGCCDRELSDKEILWNDEIGNWELCTTCLGIAMEAASGQGFQIGDPDEYESVDEEFDMFIPYAEVDELDRHVFGGYIDEYGDGGPGF